MHANTHTHTHTNAQPQTTHTHITTHKHVYTHKTLHTCMHNVTHTHTTHMHAHCNTHTHTNTNAQPQTTHTHHHTHTHITTHKHVYTHTTHYTHARTLSHTHARTLSHIHTHTHYTHARTVSHTHSYFRYNFYVSDGNFYAETSIPTGWFHLVVNFIGPNNGQGIRVYHDGEEVRGTFGQKLEGSYTNSESRVKIGRLLYTNEGFYSSVLVDELFFFNQV